MTLYFRYYYMNDLFAIRAKFSRPRIICWYTVNITYPFLYYRLSNHNTSNQNIYNNDQFQLSISGLPMISLNSDAGTSADATVKDLGRVGVSGSSIPSRVRLRVGEPPLTVARRCFGSVITGRVYWGDSDPLLNTSLSVSFPSSLSSVAISSLRQIRNHIL